MAVLKPVIGLSEAFSGLFNRRKGQPSRMTIEDILTLAQMAKMENLIEVEQESIIVNTARLKDISVQSIMVPSEWIVYLKGKRPLVENFDIARNNLHTRYPISEDDSVEGIIGYVNFKEMASFSSNLSALDIDQFIRSVLFVSSQTNLLAMLKLFIARHHHLAIVKDPKGKIIGMVTVEDVIEEIVGDIEDEFDKSVSQIVKVGECVWRIGGGVSMEALAQKIPLQLDASVYSQPVAQWLQKKITGALYPGTFWTEGKVKFIAQQVRRGRIHQVIVEVAAQSPGDNS
jgi:putative hemolysin